MGAAGAVSARKMFGEYAIYREGKLIVLVCDDGLFPKPPDAGVGSCPDEAAREEACLLRRRIDFPTE